MWRKKSESTDLARGDDIDALRQARKLLTDNGVGRGRYYNEATECYCLEGAIAETVGAFEYVDTPGAAGEDNGQFLGVDPYELGQHRAYRELRRFIYEWYGRESLTGFNDDSSPETVIAAVDGTIARLQAGDARE